MNSLLIYNIKELAGLNLKGYKVLRGEEMKTLDTLHDAWLLIEDGLIKDYGEMATLGDVVADSRMDACGGCVIPAFCDSHTHIVNAGSREEEFVDKIRGLSYAEIAKRGGGILNSADRLHEMSEDELFEKSLKRVHEVMKKGTGALEIKSGYGLKTEDELKMLRVIRRIRNTVPIPIVATFLGAHAVGREYGGRQK